MCWGHVLDCLQMTCRFCTLYSCFLEISELVEDVENIYENHVLKRHDIVRRAAARLNASVSVVSPLASYSSTSAPSPTSQPSSMSPITTRSILNTQIRPSRTAIAFVKSTYARVTANIPTTSGATSKKPNTPTTKYKTTREGTNPTRKTTKTYPSTRKRVEVSDVRFFGGYIILPVHTACPCWLSCQFAIVGKLARNNVKTGVFVSLYNIRCIFTGLTYFMIILLQAYNAHNAFNIYIP